MAKEDVIRLSEVIDDVISMYGTPHGEKSKYEEMTVLTIDDLSDEWKPLVGYKMMFPMADPAYRLQESLSEWAFRHSDNGATGKYVTMIAYAVWMGAVIYPSKKRIAFPSARDVRITWLPLAAMALTSGDATTKVDYGDGNIIYYRLLNAHKNYIAYESAKYPMFRNQANFCFVMTHSGEIVEDVINGREVTLERLPCKIITFEGSANPVFYDVSNNHLYMRHTDGHGQVHWLSEL